MPENPGMHLGPGNQKIATTHRSNIVTGNSAIFRDIALKILNFFKQNS